MSPASMRAFRAYRDRLQKEACVLDAEFADQGLLGLAREVKRAIDDGTGIVSWYGNDYPVVDSEGDLDMGALREMLRHPIYNAVTAHEVGHTVGLRHNFSGSYDSLNYKPRYWEIRDDGNMQSRAWDAETEEETNARIREYQYSTVMDYGSNFVVTDAHGIGHYDHAAIKMGYGDLVEVFDNIRSSDRRAVSWYGLFQGWGWPFIATLEAAGGGTFGTYQYTDIVDLVGGQANLQSRADVPYTSLKAEPDSFFRGLEEYKIVDQQNRPLVPYLFCSDEQADLGPDCMRYDQGADSYETLQSLIDNYWNYYIFAAFRRERIGFNVESYANRVYSRYFEKLQSANQLYALYRPIIADVWDIADNDPAWTSPGGLGALSVGAAATYGLFTRILTTPEPGSYGTGTRPDGTPAMLPDGAALNLDILDGRAIETTWDFDDAGYFWFGQIARAGFFYDKALAIQVLTDPTTYFVGRDTSADIREYQLNYYSTFGPSLTAFFRGMLSDDWAAIAPRQKTSGDLASGALDYPDATEIAEGNIPGAPVDPNASFSIQLYSAIFSTWLIPQTYDQTYMNSARIYIKGGAEQVEFSGPTVEFTDTTSGLTYVAASHEVSGVETGVGARMLQHAQALADRSETTELRKFLDNVNIMRRLSWELGFGVL